MFAIISDIHSNLEALTTVLADIEQRGIKTIYCLGDVVGYGPNPVECLDLIIEKKIGRVVIGTKDPNPKVNGRSIRILKKLGIEVSYGVLKEDCRRLNEVFFKFMETGRPFVTLKAACSLDGKIACRTGESQWISSLTSRKRVHRFRGLADAILVGIGALLALRT